MTQDNTPPEDKRSHELQDSRGHHFTIIDDAFIDQHMAKLTGAAVSAYLFLCRRADRDGVSFPGSADWESVAGLTRPTVNAAMKQLMDAGLVSVEHREGRSNLYRLENIFTKPPKGPVKNSYGTRKESLQEVDTLKNTNTPLAPQGEESVKKSSRAVKTLMPKDFDLSGPRLAYAMNQGLTPKQADDLLEDLRLWSKAKAGKYVDWDAAWQSWCRRKGQELAKVPGRRSGSTERPSKNGRTGYTSEELAKMANGGPEDEPEGSNPDVINAVFSVGQ